MLSRSLSCSDWIRIFFCFCFEYFDEGRVCFLFYGFPRISSWRVGWMNWNENNLIVLCLFLLFFYFAFFIPVLSFIHFKLPTYRELNKTDAVHLDIVIFNVVAVAYKFLFVCMCIICVRFLLVLFTLIRTTRRRCSTWCFATAQ